jgi:hypothetical protein
LGEIDRPEVLRVAHSLPTVTVATATPELAGGDYTRSAPLDCVLRPFHLLVEQMKPVIIQTAIGGVAAILMWATGCTTTRRDPASHVVKVNATATEAPKKGMAFTLVPARGAVDDSTLLYAEAVRVVTGALQTKGLFAAPTVQKADIIVELEYGVAPPRVVQLASAQLPDPTPVPVRAGVPTETDVSRLMSSARGALEKRLVLTAREAKRADDAPPRTLWSVELSTIDLSNDLRKYLPLLAAVALDEIGQDSGGALLVRVNENDKTVTLLRKSE